MKSVQIRSFFWSVFSGIRTENAEILRVSSYSVRMREKTPCLGTFHAVIINILFLNMLGADDSDLSCSLVQVIALFGHNEYPKHGIGTEVHLLWLFSLLSSQARFDGRPDLLIMTDLLA